MPVMPVMSVMPVMAVMPVMLVMPVKPVLPVCLNASSPILFHHALMVLFLPYYIVLQIFQCLLCL